MIPECKTQMVLHTLMPNTIKPPLEFFIVILYTFFMVLHGERGRGESWNQTVNTDFICLPQENMGGKGTELWGIFILPFFSYHVHLNSQVWGAFFVACSNSLLHAPWDLPPALGRRNPPYTTAGAPASASGSSRGRGRREKKKWQPGRNLGKGAHREGQKRRHNGNSHLHCVHRAPPMFRQPCLAVMLHPSK